MVDNPLRIGKMPARSRVIPTLHNPIHATGAALSVIRAREGLAFSLGLFGMKGRES